MTQKPGALPWLSCWTDEVLNARVRVVGLWSTYLARALGHFQHIFLYYNKFIGINMAIKPKCDKCGNELTFFGGIILSPPDLQNKVTKFHICRKCYEIILSQLSVKNK
jgi:hypothetical protein